MPLTDAKIRALHGKALKGEIVGKAADGGGLNFQNGKYWRMSYRFDGKQKTLALGVYPDISLKAAREARDKARTLLAQGIDPNEQKKSRRDEAERQQKEEARTFEVSPGNGSTKKLVTSPLPAGSKNSSALKSTSSRTLAELLWPHSICPK